MKKNIMVKRIIAVIAALGIAGAMAACAGSTSEQTAAETTAAQEQTSESGAEIPNPWTDVATAEEAAAGAGLASFTVCENGTESASGPIDWYGFRCMNGIAEADGAIGAAELTVRKGDVTLGDISGDYNDYAYTWETDVDGTTVYCYGNTEGQAMLCEWSNGENAFCFMVQGQGDEADTYGLATDTIGPLVSTWIG